MSDGSVARRVVERARRPGEASRPSTREIVADAAFCEVLAQDLGVKVSTARTAFVGEPKVRCIRVVEWALRHEPDDPERRAKMVLAWARKRRAGAFRDDVDAEKDIAKAVARYWVEHPDKLAETLREALKSEGAA